MYKEVFKRQKRKKRKLAGGAARELVDTDDEDGQGSDEEEEEEPPKRMEMPVPKEVGSGNRQDPIWDGDSQDIQMDLDQTPPTAAAGPTDEGGIRPERYVLIENFFWVLKLNVHRMQLFRSKLANLFATSLQDEEQIILTELLELINKGLPTDQLFGTAEATFACNAMAEVNELMLSDGIVYKI